MRVYLTSLILLLTLPLRANSPIEGARSTLKEWVETERVISEETADWKEEKRLLEDRLAALKQERDQLSTRIEEAEALLSTADEARGELLLREEGLLKDSQQLAVFLTAFEKELLLTQQRLPEPLLVKLEGLFARMEQAAEGDFSPAERMQVVTAVLSELTRFNQAVTVTREVRELGNGKSGEVQTLYFGLGAAWYLAPGAEDAGVGVPGKEGWRWESRPELAEDIRDALAIAEEASQRARFIPLEVPVR